MSRNGWERRQIGDVCELVGDPINPQQFQKEIFAHYSIPAFDAGETPTIEPGSGILSNKVAIPRGVVLFSKLNPRINRVWFVDDHRTERRICSTEFLPLQPHPDLIDAAFLSLVLQDQALLNSIRRRVAAATKSRERLNPAIVLTASIPVPPLPEQRRVAKEIKNLLVGVVNARISAVEQVKATEALRAAYLRKAFHGITPLSSNGRRAVTPQGWRWVRLTDVARLESGHTPSRNHHEWWGGDIPWIALPDIRALDGKVALDTSEHTNERGIANSAARVLPAGTVVLSRTASVGFVTIMGRPMATSQDFVNWVCGPDLEPAFLSYLLQASRWYIRSLASGAVHKTVYMPAVEAFEVCAPSPKQQGAIIAELNSRLDRAESLANSARAVLEAVRSLPAALLRRAFGDQRLEVIP